MLALISLSLGRHQPVPVPAARRRPHLLEPGREGARPPGAFMRTMERASVGRLRARADAVRDRAHQRHRPPHRRRIQRHAIVFSCAAVSVHRGEESAMEVTTAERYASGGPGDGSARPEPRARVRGDRRAASRDDPAIVAGRGDDRVDRLERAARRASTRIAGGLAEPRRREGRHRRADAEQPARVHPHATSAAVSLGAVPFSIYQTSSPEQIQYVGRATPARRSRSSRAPSSRCSTRPARTCRSSRR